MSRESMETPCPAPNSRSLSWESYNGITSNSILPDDTETGAIDYTRAVQNEFRNARPRRRQSLARNERRNAAVTIYEDVLEDQQLDVKTAAQRQQQGPGRTLLGKPAQRIRRPNGGATAPGNISQSSQSVDHSGNTAPIAPSRARLVAQQPSLEHSSQSSKQQGGDRTIAKEARRRTIFVPSDDTTIMTIHPGHGADTQALNDTFQIPELQGPKPQARPQENMLARKPRMSMAQPAQKVPLKQRRDASINKAAIDRPGDGDGKENMPPKPVQEAALRRKGLSEKGTDRIVKAQEPNLKRPRPSAAASKGQPIAPVPAAASFSPPPQARSSQLKPHDASSNPPKPTTKKPAVWQSQQQNSRKRVRKSTSPPPRSNFAQWRNTQSLASMRQSRPSLSANSKLARYPVISEDASQPALYEDSWLSHQEVALTEVINEIFHQSRKSAHDIGLAGTELRAQMMAEYHQPEVTTMYKRLQASIAYGSLGRPKEPASTVDLTHDLGLRRRYLGTLLDSYKEEHFAVAAEVVVGRQINNSAGKQPSILEASQALLDSRASRRDLTGFLETFFVRVEDNELLDGTISEPTARWQKTMLRTYMLVWLLDQTKTAGLVQGCLFKRNSTHKSSAAVLQTLCSLLNPTVGDPTRTLRQYDYELIQHQDPLEEVVYRIENIAVDLRDGILLAGLVDVLLPSESDMSQQLSQHLKIPCPGRVQKVYNVSIAIEALRGQEEAFARNIAPEDIVDGHREKTLSLLWSLVSLWGLDRLIDWTDLSRDLDRTKASLEGSALSHNECWADEAGNHDEALLHEWAAAHCHHKGIDLPNLTSAFANGRAYAAIIETFSSYLPTPTPHPHQSDSTPQPTQLQTHLSLLGCSTAFATQLSATHRPTIPSRTTTITNLAFLASRLLPLAKHHAAAITVQRAYRSRLARITISQRVSLMRMASAAAEVVQARNRKVWAVEVVQRAWRRVLAARIAGLEDEARRFQVLARGWFVRRSVGRVVREKAARERLYW